ncbi:hypothetical protein Acr_00g0017480 [Actinidia rufa]|uniref:Uncharacterized protein n=1 Tax=Actinidia rufa TaxID=165716 RepID=A0A7J0DBG6_9ERIC|nr:hypothetical protein Acr_00g0017480 [Actinidia rufa]
MALTRTEKDLYSGQTRATPSISVKHLEIDERSIAVMVDDGTDANKHVDIEASENLSVDSKQISKGESLERYSEDATQTLGDRQNAQMKSGKDQGLSSAVKRDDTKGKGNQVAMKKSFASLFAKNRLPSIRSKLEYINLDNGQIQLEKEDFMLSYCPGERCLELATLEEDSQMPEGGEHEQRIYYENLPKYCPHCRVVGHTKENCKNKTGSINKATGKNSATTEKVDPQQVLIQQEWVIKQPNLSKDNPSPVEPAHPEAPMESVQGKMPEEPSFLNSSICRQKHDNFQSLVRNSWGMRVDGTAMYKLCRKLKALKEPLKSLNNLHFSHILARSLAVEEELQQAQLQLHDNPSDTQLQLVIPELRAKAIKLAEAKMSYCSQLAKAKFLKNSDKGTKFFHNMIKSRHMKRNISSITLEDGSSSTSNRSYYDSTVGKGPLPGVSNTDIEIIKGIIGFSQGSFPFRYLGIPVADSRLKIAQYSPLIAKISDNINAWAGATLSYAGRTELMKSVLQGVECFWLSILPIPSGVKSKIVQLCKKFLSRVGNANQQKTTSGLEEGHSSKS